MVSGTRPPILAETVDLLRAADLPLPSRGLLADGRPPTVPLLWKLTAPGRPRVLPLAVAVIPARLWTFTRDSNA